MQYNFDEVIDRKNTNAVNDSVLINGAKALDGFSENIKDGIKNLPGGTDDRVNPDLKRFADNNATQNETTYKNSKLGNNNLVENNTFGKDDINSSQLSKTSTEECQSIGTGFDRSWLYHCIRWHRQSLHAGRFTH